MTPDMGEGYISGVFVSGNLLDPRVERASGADVSLFSDLGGLRNSLTCGWGRRGRSIESTGPGPDESLRTANSIGPCPWEGGDLDDSCVCVIGVWERSIPSKLVAAIGVGDSCRLNFGVKFGEPNEVAGVPCPDWPPLGDSAKSHCSSNGVTPVDDPD